MSKADILLLVLASCVKVWFIGTFGRSYLQPEFKRCQWTSSIYPINSQGLEVIGQLKGLVRFSKFGWWQKYDHAILSPGSSSWNPVMISIYLLTLLFCGVSLPTPHRADSCGVRVCGCLISSLSPTLHRRLSISCNLTQLVRLLTIATVKFHIEVLRFCNIIFAPISSPPPIRHTCSHHGWFSRSSSPLKFESLAAPWDQHGYLPANFIRNVMQEASTSN